MFRTASGFKKKTALAAVLVESLILTVLGGAVFACGPRAWNPFPRDNPKILEACPYPHRNLSPVDRSIAGMLKTIPAARWKVDNASRENRYVVASIDYRGKIYRVRYEFLENGDAIVIKIPEEPAPKRYSDDMYSLVNRLGRKYGTNRCISLTLVDEQFNQYGLTDEQ